jgi:Protein of unknown function (DUF2842)
MRARLRKLLGTVLIVVFVLVYVLVVVAIGVGRVADAGPLAKLGYFVIAGLVWVVPAAVLIRWMQKPDAPAPSLKRR